MPLPLAPMITGAIAALVTKVFEFAYKFFAYKLARNLAVATGAIVIAAGLTLGMAQLIKAAILAARIAMPASLGIATYFLPPNINQVLAVAITIRSAHFIWQWSMKNLSRYTMQIHV